MNNAIHISVSTKYLGRQQNNEGEAFVFSYTVNITNTSNTPMTLRERYWLITNGNGEKVEVSGKGVVGEQPTIAPQQSFEYTSASRLKTEVGTRQGHYILEQAVHSTYLAPILAISLAVPNALH